jgi:hypothetical protein
MFDFLNVFVSIFAKESADCQIQFAINFMTCLPLLLNAALNGHLFSLISVFFVSGNRVR